MSHKARQQAPSSSKRSSRRRSSAGAVLFVAVGMAVTVLANIAVAQPGGGRALAARAKPSPPVIREHFTLLPCPDPKNPRTTLEMEGCAEHATVRADTKINRVAKTIFSALGSDAARRRFIKAQRAWLAYRDADCRSVSDKYEGGTLAPVADAECTADRTARHLTEIRAFAHLLRTP